MAQWKFLAQDARTREWLHTDLPLTVQSMTWVLSGAGQFSASCTPDTGTLRTASGDLILRPWGTFIYAESDGVIRWGGIVVDSDVTASRQSWRIDAAGFATYPNGISFAQNREWVQVDPVVPFGAIWSDVQSQHGGMSDLDLLVVADPTNVLVGYSGTVGDGSGRIYFGQVTAERWAELILDGWTQQSEGSSSWLNPPPRVFRSVLGDAAFQKLLDDEGYRAEEKPTGAADNWVPSYADPPLVTVQADPYVLRAYEVPDCGSKIDDLTRSTPFDWVERHWWVPSDDVIDATQTDPDLVEWLLAHGWYGLPNDGTEALYRPADAPDREVAHVIRVYWPRVGTRRTDLAFTQPDNLVDPVSPTMDGSDYANTVIGIGAGQGPTILRWTVGQDDGNLYREAVYTDKAITDSGLMDAQVRDELAWRQGQFDVTEVTVFDHPNAPIGSWQLGDDVFIRAYVPWFGDVNLWVRITGWEWVNEHTAKLTVTRSDSFRYGG